MALTIRVREIASKYVPAERAELRLTVSAEGPAKAEIAERTRVTLDQIIGHLRALQESGAVRRWSNERVTTQSHRPWGDDGRQGELVHRVSAEVWARFSDFEELADAVERWSEVDELTLEEIEWGLTKATTHATEAELRTQVVRSATLKAQQYAHAAGSSTVQPVSISDANDGGWQEQTGQGVYLRAMSASSGGSQLHLTLKPRDIEISVAVNGEFTADQ